MSARSRLLLIPAALLCAALGYYAAHAVALRTVSPARPLGAAIPDPPPPMFEVQPHADGSSSYSERRLPDAWIDTLAPQPDGLPPLERRDIARLDFTIGFPYGMEHITFPDAHLMEQGIDSVVEAAIDQPLSTARISVSRHGAATVKERVEELLAALREQGATGVRGPEQAKLPAGEMLRIEYEIEGRDRAGRPRVLRHRTYILPVANGAILLDFGFLPARSAEGSAMAEKIMRSVEPGPSLSALIAAADPDDRPASAVPVPDDQRSEH